MILMDLHHLAIRFTPILVPLKVNKYGGGFTRKAGAYRSRSGGRNADFRPLHIQKKTVDHERKGPKYAKSWIQGYSNSPVIF